MSGVAFPVPLNEEAMRRIVDDVVDRMRPAWYQRPVGLIVVGSASGVIGGLVVLAVQRLTA